MTTRIYRYTVRDARLYNPVYRNYRSYLDFLRDDFDFRCGYCLHRETWDQPASFEIDHWNSSKEPPELRAQYANLVYSCRTCNLQKLQVRLTLQPLRDNLSMHLSYSESGLAVPLTPRGKAFVRQLSLNAQSRVDLRRRWLALWALVLQASKPELVAGWPTHLPNLTVVRPRLNRVNTDRCYFQLRQRNLLPPLLLGERPTWSLKPSTWLPGGELPGRGSTNQD